MYSFFDYRMLSKTLPWLVRLESNKLINKSLNKLRYNSTNVVPAAKTSKKTLRNFFLYTTVVTTGSLVVYYEFALNAQERRRFRVTLESFGRALRAFKVGVQVITDYKWSLWNLDDVNIASLA